MQRLGLIRKQPETQKSTEMADRRLLIVDDDRMLLESMGDWLSSQGFTVSLACSAEQAKLVFEQTEHDLCLVDINLEGSDGFSFLKWATKKSAGTPVIMMTGYAGPDAGAEAVSLGAFDLLTKPIIDQELLTTLDRASSQKTIAEENRRLKQELDRRAGMAKILSHDPQMLSIFDVVDSVADTKASVLITGENGTGKSMIARAIHQRSSRAAAPFVEVACGALPDALLESELFGHKAGAFTGAQADKIGKFEYADGGTIFLDEIGTATQALQIKLLRVLQELQFEPVGGNETVSVDARCILATNEDLAKAVEEKTFRQDLYYRINVIHLELPALRERAGDIPTLVDYFLQKTLAETPKEVEGFSPEAIEAMLGYNWPGNIRELENVVQRAVLLAKTPQIGAELLPPALLGASEPAMVGLARIQPGQTLREALETPERQIILEVLRANQFSRNLTADQLGINRTTLYKKMKRLGIEDLQFQD